MYHCMYKTKNKEVLEALETPSDDLTMRQHIIIGTVNELIDEKNTGITRHEILEKAIVKVIRIRRRGLITQKEYRERMRVLEMFIFEGLK